MGGVDVQIRGSKTTIVGPVDIRPLSCITDHPDVCDRVARQLGIITGITNIVTTINAPANPIINYNTTLGLGAGSSAVNNYVTTGNFRLSSIEVSASGALKVEVKSGNVGSETTKLVAFTTESNLTVQLRFYEELSLTIGQRIQVIITNRELQAQDIYNTIMGFNT